MVSPEVRPVRFFKAHQKQDFPKGSASSLRLAEAVRITQTMGTAVEDLRMRLKNLSFLLGLVSAGACTSGKVNRAEPANPPPLSVQRAEAQAITPPARPKPPEQSGSPSKPPAPSPEVRRDDEAQAKGEGQSQTDEQAKTSETKSPEVEVVEEKYDNGVIRKRVEGKRNAEGEFVPHGLTTTWYESGLKWTEITFRDGVKNGPQRKWYNTGAEWSNSGYSDGVEHGVWTAYHPNGEKAREIHIDHGVWEGPYVEYHPNGRKSMEVMFVKGLRQGISTVYNDDGTVAFVTDYIDGVEQP